MNLSSTGQCMIYEERPEVCRVKDGQWEANAILCNEMQEEAGLPESLRVVVDLARAQDPGTAEAQERDKGSRLLGSG